MRAVLWNGGDISLASRRSSTVSHCVVSFVMRCRIVRGTSDLKIRAFEVRWACVSLSFCGQRVGLALHSRAGHVEEA